MCQLISGLDIRSIGSLTLDNTIEDAGKTVDANNINIYDTSDVVGIGPVTHKVHFIVHELGHAFNAAVGGAPP